MTLGIGDCDGTLCGPNEADTGPSFGTGGGVYVRPIPYFAAGFDLHWQLMGADDRDFDRTGEIANYFLLNLALRGIIPIEGRVEPWGGIGFGYAHWGYDWDEDRDSEDLTFNGINFALSTGADVRLVDRWWLGGMVRFAFPDWGERCRDRIRPDRVEEECRDVDTLDADERAELPDFLWYLGVNGRVDF